MTSPLSVRFDAALFDRLRRRDAMHHSTPSGLARRLVDERRRIQEHPGIVFGTAPARGADRGPDVWEVVSAAPSSGAKDEKHAIAETATDMSLPPTQVQVALEYHGSFAAEIDAHVVENERAAGYDGRRRS